MHRRIVPISLLALAVAAPAAARGFDFGTIGTRSTARSPIATLHMAEAVRGGRGPRAAELTPLLKQLALSLPRLSGADRVRAERLLARPTQNETAPDEAGYSVREHKPALCSQHFCIHWVDSTADAPPPADANHNGVPDYVETVDGVFEHVYQVENVQLGWRAAKSDGNRGGNSLVDVYLKDVGGQGLYGYSSPDPGQRGHHQEGYLVLDNDFNRTQFPKYGGNPLPPIEVTAAHEYNHVLQFNYDVAQDTWLFESTAVWMEDKVYTDVNDYLQYLTPWSQLAAVPITQFNENDQSDPFNIKVYGDAVWPRWIDSHIGADTIRNAWELSLKTKPESFGPGAYDAALKAHGSSFFDAFTRFVTDTAEWRDSNSAFSEGSTFPDIQRTRDHTTRRPITLSPNRGDIRGKLQHTAFALVDVALTQAPRIKLVATFPDHTESAIALVCRVGNELTGSSSETITRLPHGGEGTATLDSPGRCSRITAVLVNADRRTNGHFSPIAGDWIWLKDDQPVEGHISTDFTPPALRSRSPRPGQGHVSTRSRIRVRLSERIARADSRTVVLVGPGGRRIRATIRRHGSEITIVPHGRLKRGTRYTVRLSSVLQDGGGNRLPASVRHWTFSTRR